MLVSRHGFIIPLPPRTFMKLSRKQEMATLLWKNNGRNKTRRDKRGEISPSSSMNSLFTICMRRRREGRTVVQILLFGRLVGGMELQEKIREKSLGGKQIRHFICQVRGAIASRLCRSVLICEELCYRKRRLHPTPCAWKVSDGYSDDIMRLVSPQWETGSKNREI